MSSEACLNIDLEYTWLIIFEVRIYKILKPQKRPLD